MLYCGEIGQKVNTKKIMFRYRYGFFCGKELHRKQKRGRSYGRLGMD
jgi:hypothetical protein